MGCNTCAMVCPSSAIKVAQKPEKAWELTKCVEVADSSLCIGCGACTEACPSNAVNLVIKEVKFSGEYNEIFWNPLIERLKNLKREG